MQTNLKGHSYQIEQKYAAVGVVGFVYELGTNNQEVLHFQLFCNILCTNAKYLRDKIKEFKGTVQQKLTRVESDIDQKVFLFH
jgi:hypothetical protein